jgi:hypothetical protein
MPHESLPFIYQFHSFSILGPHNNRQYFVKYKNLVHVQQATEGDEREESGGEGRGAVSCLGYRLHLDVEPSLLSLLSADGRLKDLCVGRGQSALGRGTGVDRRAFCFCNIPKRRHFKNTSLNMGFTELPSKHGLHRSFASENVFLALSPRKRMAPVAIVILWCSYCSSHYCSSLRAARVG